MENLAIFRDGLWRDHVEYDRLDEPGAAILQGDGCIYARGLRSRYPGSLLVGDLRAVSFLGSPLRDASGQVVGVVSAIDCRRLRHGRKAVVLLALLAKHASMELERARFKRAANPIPYQDLSYPNADPVISMGAGLPAP